MTCDERRDHLLLYAAGQLDQTEQEEMRSHLSTGCAACAGALAEAEATFHAIPLSLDPVAPPRQARDRLMQRVLAGGSAPASDDLFPARKPEARRRRILTTYWTAIAAGFLVAWFVVPLVRDNPAQRALVQTQQDLKNWIETLQRERAASAKLAEQFAATDARLKDADLRLAAISKQAAEAKALLEAQNLTMVSLPGEKPGMPNGRVLFDVSNRRWHVRVFDLKPLPPDKTYELWFITPDQKKIPAGTFDVDEKGSGSIMVSVPQDVRVSLAAITDEPAGGAPQPTGSIHLAGQVQVQ